MAGIKQLWDAGLVSFATSVGFSDNTRSHFFEQAKLERSAPTTIRTGWLGRYLMAVDPSGNNLFTEMAFGRSRVASTQNVDPIITTTNLTNFTIGAGGPNSNFANQIRAIGSSSGGLVGEVTTKTIDAMRRTQPYAQLGTPSNGAVYDKNNQFGINMHQIANIIKANVGLKVVAVDIDGWDTHGNEVTTMAERLSTLSKNIVALKTDLGSQFNNITIIVQSEFGRTTVENANKGCDHGNGNILMCVSGKANGKKVVGTWNGLGTSVTDKQGDIIPVNDHRDFMAEALVKSLGATPAILSQVFPQYTPKTMGILQ